MVIEIFLGGLALLYAVKSFQHDTAQAKSRVYSTFRKAFKMTKKHIDNTRSGEFGEVDFADIDSDELANAWGEAAEAIKPYNPGLAQIFYQKSDYWRSPYGFYMEIQEEKRRFDYKFRIDEVENELLRMEREGV